MPRISFNSLAYTFRSLYSSLLGFLNTPPLLTLLILSYTSILSRVSSSYTIIRYILRILIYFSSNFLNSLIDYNTFRYNYISSYSRR